MIDFKRHHNRTVPSHGRGAGFNSLIAHHFPPRRNTKRTRRQRLEAIGTWLIAIAIIGMILLLVGCGSGSSSAGAGSSKRVPLTAADQQAVAMLGGFGGEWMPQTRGIIRLDQPPPSGANWARAWRSQCREAFTIYETTRGKSPQWLARLFAHEAQHHIDGCKAGAEWEKRANNAARCFQRGISREDCNL